MLFSCLDTSTGVHTPTERLLRTGIRLLSSRVLISESFSCSEIGDTHKADLIAAWALFTYLFIYFPSVCFLEALEQKAWHSQLAHASRCW